MLTVAGLVVVGTAAGTASAPSTTRSTTASTGSTTAVSPSPVSTASTSSRGVTDDSINVVFPAVSLNSLAGREGFAEDAEYGEQQRPSSSS